MAILSSPTTSLYVQQAFNWDALDTGTIVAKTATLEECDVANSRPVNRCSTSTSPSYSTSTSARRGRCEHVGGILASVLERYGIGVDQLIAEIDGLK